MKPIYSIFVIFLSHVLSYAQVNFGELKEGYWKLQLKVGSELAPALIKVIKERDEVKNTWHFYLIRGNDEVNLPVLKLTEAKGKNTSQIVLGLHVFNAELNFDRYENYQFKGHWIRKDKDPNESYDISMKFFGDKVGDLFEVTKNPPKFNINGRWKWIFNPGTEDEEIGLGIYEQNQNFVKGSIATSTGDYGLQEGVISGTELILSCFDGVFAYVLKGNWNKKNIEGTMFTVKGEQKFIALKDEKFKLPDPLTLTHKKNSDVVKISFPTIDKTKVISTENKEYINKPLIIQIYGSWCPNCRDETIFLSNWYKTQTDKNKIEIISLAFEKAKTEKQAIINIKRSIDQLIIPYQIVLASYDNLKKPNEILPIENFISYPTTLFLDKKHKVVKIHTGFSGPSTGEEYLGFVKLFNETISELLK